jgi:hypothetical protein
MRTAFNVVAEIKECIDDVKANIDRQNEENESKQPLGVSFDQKGHESWLGGIIIVT